MSENVFEVGAGLVAVGLGVFDENVRDACGMAAAHAVSGSTLFRVETRLDMGRLSACDVGHQTIWGVLAVAVLAGRVRVG